MHIKRRGNRAMLYRSSWVPKWANGNTHGYAIQAFVASLPLDAESLPADFPEQLTEQELKYIETKIFEPARLASRQKRRAVDAREADPMWRLDDAVRLISEAAERSERAVAPNSKVAAVQSAVNKVRTISQHQASVPEQSSSDPLRDALTPVDALR